MIVIKIKFSCILCGQNRDFYISPEEIKKGNSFIYSLTDYKVICKKCQKTYKIKIKIEG